ncbi:MAG: hypothetical protein Q8N85_01815 [Candidatus Omnitrophota bacterium]|nr:hypothetical protein [Candidatus Omnitrophota bacterium]
MRTEIFPALILAVLSLFFGASAVFSQEPAAPASANAAAVDSANITSPAVSSPAEAETQWQYVEVVSVDPQKKEILAKYIDYETDEVKQITLSADDKTTYENVISISEIKPLDTAGVDYIVAPDGKSLARNISVEKAQETPLVTPAPETSAAPVAVDTVTPANP